VHLGGISGHTVRTEALLEESNISTRPPDSPNTKAEDGSRYIAVSYPAAPRRSPVITTSRSISG